MVDYERNYLGMLGIDETVFLYGRIGVPDEVIAELLKQFKKAAGHAFHPDKTREQPEPIRKRLEDILKGLNSLFEATSDVDGWRTYKRERRAYLQRSGQVDPLDVRYGTTIDQLNDTIRRLGEDIRAKQAELEKLRGSGGASSKDLEDAKRRVRELEAEKDRYKREVGEARAEYEREKKDKQRLSDRVTHLERESGRKDDALRAAEDLVKNRFAELMGATAERDQLKRTVDAYETVLGGVNAQVDIAALAREVYNLRKENEKLGNEHYAELARSIREGDTTKAKTILEEHFRGYDIEREHEIIRLYDEAVIESNNNSSAALDKFRRVSTLDGRHTASRLGAARVAIQTSNFDSAIQSIDEAIAINPNLPEAYFLLARAQLNLNNDADLGKVEYIKWLCWKAEEINGNYSERTKPIRDAAQYQAEMIWKIRRGNTAEAKAILEQHFGVETGYDQSRANKLIELYNQAIGRIDSDRNEAERIFSEIVNIDNKHLAARLGLFKLTFDRGEFSTAKTHAYEAIKIDEGSAEAHYSLALSTLRLNGTSEADFIAWECYRAEQLDPGYKTKTKPIREVLGKVIA